MWDGTGSVSPWRPPARRFTSGRCLRYREIAQSRGRLDTTMDECRRDTLGPIRDDSSARLQGTSRRRSVWKRACAGNDGRTPQDHARPMGDPVARSRTITKSEGAVCLTCRGDDEATASAAKVQVSLRPRRRSHAIKKGSVQDGDLIEQYHFGDVKIRPWSRAAWWWSGPDLQIRNGWLMALC